MCKIILNFHKPDSKTTKTVSHFINYYYCGLTGHFMTTSGPQVGPRPVVWEPLVFMVRSDKCSLLLAVESMIHKCCTKTRYQHKKYMEAEPDSHACLNKQQ